MVGIVSVVLLAVGGIDLAVRKDSSIIVDPCLSFAAISAIDVPW